MSPKNLLAIFLAIFLLQAVICSPISDDDTELESLLDDVKREDTEIVRDEFEDAPAATENEESDATPLDIEVDNVDHMEEERKLGTEEDMTDDDYYQEEAARLLGPRYGPVGCYLDKGGDNRPLPELLENLRPKINKVWSNLDEIIQMCANLTESKGYTYFGIQFWGECWSGPKADQTYNRDGQSKGCAVGLGKAGSYFIYRFKPITTTAAPPTPTPLPGECTDYMVLDSADRSINQGPLDSGIFKCDKDLTPGWYRFMGEAGTQIPTSCVPKLHCGAHSPGWMKGALPSVAEGSVQRNVCYNWMDNCCYWKNDIMVRNCGEYFVYKLQKPSQCRLRYCGNGRGSEEDMTDDDYYQEEAARLLGPRYGPVGCYLDKGGDNRPLPELLENLRPKINKVWSNLDEIIQMCANLTESKGYTYFGLQFWGECWSGPKADQTYNRDGPSNDCAVGLGKAGSYFVYRFKPKTTTAAAPTPSPLPGECTDYMVLDSADRSINQGHLDKCDKGLTPGWYRFMGEAGTQIPTSCVSKNHCGTRAPGWMKGALPSVAEGSVERKVCFSWTRNCCFWKQTIMVRNCGGHFVYKLQKPPACKLRYCGIGPETTTSAPPTPTTLPETTTAAPPTTLPGECINYKVLDSADRSINQGTLNKCDKDLTPGWYRFMGEAGTQIPTSCVPKLHCGTHSPGWMTGELPSVAEGSVQRDVCFSWTRNCCFWKRSIMVRNCGGHFVYKLQKPNQCKLRYCGNGRAISTTSKPTTAKPTTLAPTTPKPTRKPRIRSFILCEHRSGVLRCPRGQRVKVLYANYGRTTGRYRCPHIAIRTTKCLSRRAANLIRCACNGRTSCPLFAKNQVYGDPCVGTYKYIEVKYWCI